MGLSAVPCHCSAMQLCHRVPLFPARPLTLWELLLAFWQIKPSPFVYWVWTFESQLPIGSNLSSSLVQISAPPLDRLHLQASQLGLYSRPKTLLKDVEVSEEMSSFKYLLSRFHSSQKQGMQFYFYFCIYGRDRSRRR